MNAAGPHRARCRPARAISRSSVSSVPRGSNARGSDDTPLTVHRGQDLRADDERTESWPRRATARGSVGVTQATRARASRKPESTRATMALRLGAGRAVGDAGDAVRRCGLQLQQPGHYHGEDDEEQRTPAEAQHDRDPAAAGGDHADDRRGHQVEEHERCEQRGTTRIDIGFHPKSATNHRRSRRGRSRATSASRAASTASAQHPERLSSCGGTAPAATALVRRTACPRTSRAGSPATRSRA